MKQHLTLILLTLGLTLTANAQRIHGFVSSGLIVSQIEGDALKGFKHYGYTGGVGAITPLDPRGRWGLSIEALYTQQGSLSRTILTDQYIGRFDLNYINIPLLLHYQDYHGGMLLGAGLAYGRLVQQPHGTLQYDEHSLIPDTTDLTFLRNDLAAIIDARFTIWRGLQLNLRWQHSLLPIKRDWLFKQINGVQYTTYTNNCYNHAITIRLIYQF